MHRHKGLKQAKVLFIIKERLAYGTKTKAYGLVNSCIFVAEHLKKYGIQADVVEVVDNNSIDRVVTQYKPTHVFVEAVWVVPSKFRELARLHPKVSWNVRIHSMVPFLTAEGMAFEWINQYLELQKDGIDISMSVNNRKMQDDMNSIYNGAFDYTPNIYHPEITGNATETFIYPRNGIMHIGCFGALRVLKNHTQQAIWAMEFAERKRKKLYFHINISEHEQREAGPILRNIRAIFANTDHVLVEHLWYNHRDFLELVKKMDFGMQVSFTETFNVVAADFVYCEVPIVVSEQIKFVIPECRANAGDKSDVFRAMEVAYRGMEKKEDRWFGCLSAAFQHARQKKETNWFRDSIAEANKDLLKEHNRDSIREWVDLLR